MTRLDSLITPRAMSFGKANPWLADALMYVFDAETELNTRTKDFGLRRVGLPCDEAVVPAVSVTLGILATVLTTAQLSTPWDESLAEQMMISAMRARKFVLAELQADRETHDSRLRMTFDPTDPASDVLYEADRQALGMFYGPTAPTAELESSVATRPDAVSSSTQADLADYATYVATRLGAEPVIIDAIMTPDFGTRTREGLGPIMRAAGLPTSGRNLKTSKTRVETTLWALRLAGRISSVVNGPRINSSRGRRVSWSAEACYLADTSTENQYYAPGTHNHGCKGNDITRVPEQAITVITPEAWVRPMPRQEQIGVTRTSPELTQGQASAATSGYAGGKGASAGVKIPNRRKGSRGQTGPTVPETLQDTVDVFVQLPSQQDRRDNLTALTRSLTRVSLRRAAQ